MAKNEDAEVGAMQQTDGPGDQPMQDDAGASAGGLLSTDRAIAIGAVLMVLAIIATALATYVVLDGRSSSAIQDLESEVASLRESRNADATRIGELTADLESATADRDALTASEAALEERIAALQGRLEALQAENATLRSQLDQGPGFEPSTPTIAFESTLRYAEGSFDEDQYLLVVDILVTNDTDTVGFFSTYDFELKAPDQTRYAILALSAVASQPRFISGIQTLPGGRVEIQSQALDPGESVRGSVVFYVTDPSVTDFTITYHDTQYDFTV